MSAHSPTPQNDPTSAPEQPAIESARPEDFEAGNACATTSAKCPVSLVRKALRNTGWMAQRYPWQATGLTVLTIGCGFLCEYFAISIIGAWLLYAGTLNPETGDI